MEEAGCVYRGSEINVGTSVSSAQYCCEAETLLKK